MSLTEQWDEELHRAEAVLKEDNRRFGRLRLVADTDDDVATVPSQQSERSDRPPASQD